MARDEKEGIAVLRFGIWMLTIRTLAICAVSGLGLWLLGKWTGLL